MRTQLTGTGPQVVAQGLYIDSSERVHNLGELVHSNDGRMFRYCKVGGTALVAGSLYQASAEDTTNQHNLVAAVNSIGDTLVVTTDTVTLAVNLLAGGFL